MDIIKYCCMEFSSSEEWLAFEIYTSISRYYSSMVVVGGGQLDFPKALLNEINFEILDKVDMEGKRHLICISLSIHINQSLLELHMMTIGVNKTFIDKSIIGGRRFLSVWI